MQRGAKAAVVSGVLAVVVGGAAYGAYHVFHGTADGSAASAHAAPKPVNTAPPSPAEVRTTAHDFLAAWAAGDTAKAAGLTDDVSHASTQLATFRSGLHATALTMADKPATGFTVPFAVQAKLSYAGHDSSFGYDSALTVVRGASGKAVVKWAPTVIYPKLTAGQTLEAAPEGAPPLTAVDRNGKPLTAAEYPSLTAVLRDLQTRYGAKMNGTPATVLRIRKADGSAGPTLKQLSQGKAGKPLPTTIDASLQAEAEKAVKTQGPDAAVVAVKASTGEVLAVANNPAGTFNKGFQGNYAPGSTFKVITASTLLEAGKYNPSTPLDCPKTISLGGLSFHNVDKMEIKNATLAQDFENSCNTAFISTANVLPDGAVEQEAHDVYGLGLQWNTGVPSFDGSVPTTPGASKAMTYIGQGRVVVSPLDMASVAATAKTGSFHQPVIVPVSVDNRQIAQAPRQLSATADQQLRAMMKLTAQEGTAAPTISGLSGDVGAKTGTAEVDGQTKPNSWFLAYRDDVASAAVVPNSGEGYKFAGKIVTAVLGAS